MISERGRWHFAPDSSQRGQILIVDGPRNGSAHGQHQDARGRRRLHGCARQGQGQRHGASEHWLLQPRARCDAASGAVVRCVAALVGSVCSARSTAHRWRSSEISATTQGTVQRPSSTTRHLPHHAPCSTPLVCSSGCLSASGPIADRSRSPRRAAVAMSRPIDPIVVQASTAVDRYVCVSCTCTALHMRCIVAIRH